MRNINAGDLRHRVSLVRNTNPDTPNSVGQAKPVPTTIGTYYALVECLGGSEGVNANQLKGVLNWKVTLRASAGPIYPSDQLAWKGLTLNVTEAAPDPFGIMIEVKATSKGQQ